MIPDSEKNFWNQVWLPTGFGCFWKLVSGAAIHWANYETHITQVDLAGEKELGLSQEVHEQKESSCRLPDGSAPPGLSLARGPMGDARGGPHGAPTAVQIPGEALPSRSCFQQAGSCQKTAPASSAAKAFNNTEYLNVAIAPLI